MQNSGKLARAPAGRDNPFYAAETLREIRNVFPHDCVNHFQSLFLRRFGRLAVRRVAGLAQCPLLHARLPCESMGRFFNRLFLFRDLAVDDTDIPDG